jgi:hypothetical protein
MHPALPIAEVHALVGLWLNGSRSRGLRRKVTVDIDGGEKSAFAAPGSVASARVVALEGVGHPARTLGASTGYARI